MTLLGSHGSAGGHGVSSCNVASPASVPHGHSPPPPPAGVARTTKSRTANPSTTAAERVAGIRVSPLSRSGGAFLGALGRHRSNPPPRHPLHTVATPSRPAAGRAVNLGEEGRPRSTNRRAHLDGDTETSGSSQIPAHAPRWFFCPPYGPPPPPNTTHSTLRQGAAAGCAAPLWKHLAIATTRVVEAASRCPRLGRRQGPLQSGARGGAPGGKGREGGA